MPADWNVVKSKGPPNAYNSVLVNFIPVPLRNFIQNLFSNSGNPPLRINVLSPFGIRILDGGPNLHQGVDFAFEGGASGTWFIGIADSSILEAIVASTIFPNTYGYKVNAYYAPGPGEARQDIRNVSIVQPGNGYGWMVNFQPATTQGNVGNEPPLTQNNLEWNISFAHLAGPPFVIKTNVLPSANNDGTIGPATINGRQYTFFRRNGKYVYAFCSQCSVPNIYQDLASNEIYILDSARGRTIYKHGFTNFGRRVVWPDDGGNGYFNRYGSPGLIELDKSDPGDNKYATFKSSLLAQKVGFIMGSSGSFTKGIHYHVNLMYKCNYLNILEAIPDTANLPFY